MGRGFEFAGASRILLSASRSLISISNLTARASNRRNSPELPLVTLIDPSHLQRHNFYNENAGLQSHEFDHPDFHRYHYMWQHSRSGGRCRLPCCFYVRFRRTANSRQNGGWVPHRHSRRSRLTGTELLAFRDYRSKRLAEAVLFSAASRFTAAGQAPGRSLTSAISAATCAALPVAA